MGHIHLGVLPGSKPWEEVVALLDDGANDQAVVAASARAAERSLAGAANDAVYVEAVRLLLTIPFCGRSEDFGAALRDAGVTVGNKPALLEIVTAVVARLDDVAGHSSSRTDLGDLAGRALSGAIMTGIGDRLSGLFEASAEDLHAMARKVSWSRGISEFTRLFYSRLVSDCLAYWLDRTMATKIGPDQRLTAVSDRTLFDTALMQYATESTRIIQEFSGGWYGKTLHAKGGIGTRDATIFGAVALKKIVAELQVKRGPDA